MALKIEYLPVGKLLRYAKNSRTHSDEQVEQLVNSIREFGFTNPVLIDEKNELIAGHGRLAAAEILEMDKVPAIRLSNLSEKQKKAYRIADNKLALNAGWDMQLLAEEVKELMDDDFDIDLLGFNDAELDEMLSDEQPQEEDDNSSPVVQIKYLAIDQERIPATDMEIALLLDVYRQYHDAHETHEGFVQYLANGCK
ncbi:TPA: ParB N-terminal domain-containing protein [Escherichia coli]|uniref:ParB/Srx family N-terminal domain-containing protein n=1 Tax=Escherichia coli TaxID=562 RepID=UPI001275399C|nr:ParB/Srx family N-terminal domain-containing protein [Escherichia coli]ECJ1661468.1 nuclease [Salmonella enterica subsp. enterica serovar Rissen]ECU0472443.1 nuclease [Salmonella enterica subsp. enterica serovar Infantis]EEZ8953153.1 ParB N-terminal domain-containing protein [Escherichia coli O35]EDK7883631.1 nuclease [Salmonella enterica subsp. enterica serovar Infantis]EEW1681178.1 nuclease [Escherichia coli]